MCGGMLMLASRALLQMVSSDYIFLCPEDTFIRVLYTVVSGPLALHTALYFVCGRRPGKGTIFYHGRKSKIILDKNADILRLPAIASCAGWWYFRAMSSILKWAERNLSPL